ncbi:MAG: hypothetical protein ACJAUG_002575 [Halioglobus sp.]|jgi:hypothetical protein
MRDEDIDYSEDDDSNSEVEIEKLFSRFSKETRPLDIRREIERRLELARMRDQLGIDSFDL